MEQVHTVYVHPWSEHTLLMCIGSAILYIGVATSTEKGVFRLTRRGILAAPVAVVAQRPAIQ